jgi:hypothetical protein
MSENDDGNVVKVGFKKGEDGKIHAEVNIENEKGEVTEHKVSDSSLEGKTPREADLEAQLASIAIQDFNIEKEKLAQRLRDCGKSDLADMAKLITSPEQLSTLEEIAEAKESENYHAPSGRASLPANSSSGRPFQWKNQTYGTAKEMIDSLYNRLEQQGVSKEERDAIDRTISELFRKMKTGNMEVKG